MDAKAAVADIPDPPLPAASRARRKTGFVTPVGRWLHEAGKGAGGAGGDADGANLSKASRNWAVRIWKAGWTGPVVA